MAMRNDVAGIPGLQHLDHVGLTVPDLDSAVAFFVEQMGAEELYRSKRGPDTIFMPANFAVDPDASLELSMLRLPPNINIELFQWSGNGRRSDAPRAGDAGGHHLCFVVDDVDAAVAHLARSPGVRILGEVKEVGPDSMHVAGNRWTYFLTPWGLQLELVDRSRVASPPNFVGPKDWTGEKESA
jgi:catechol 2,3-dioxygenase-like lactoylglutathione lyase family enzyme